MRLVNYGLGEILDRLTILALKIRHTTGDAAHFRAERAALLAQLRGKDPTGPWLESALDLAAVNAAIWHNEDGLRRARQQVQAGGEGDRVREWLIEAGERGIRSQSLNDERAKLIETINKLVGQHVGAEKVGGAA